jgi:carbon monoxide dehydrogenase subunit G
MDFSISVEIDAPPERVWAVMSDIERWPEWTPSVTRIERLDAGPLGPGSQARIRQPKLLPALWTVTALATGHSFAWTTGGPGVRVVARHAVEAVGRGSRATLSLQFGGVLGGLVARLTRGLNNRYLNLEAAGLKSRSERAPM